MGQGILTKTAARYKPLVGGGGAGGRIPGQLLCTARTFRVRGYVPRRSQSERIPRHAALDSGAGAVIEHQHGEEDRQVHEGEEEFLARPALSGVGAQPADAVAQEEEAGQKRGGEVEAAAEPERDEEERDRDQRDAVAHDVPARLALAARLVGRDDQARARVLLAPEAGPPRRWAGAPRRPPARARSAAPAAGPAGRPEADGSWCASSARPYPAP